MQSPQQRTHDLSPTPTPWSDELDPPPPTLFLTHVARSAACRLSLDRPPDKPHAPAGLLGPHGPGRVPARADPPTLAVAAARLRPGGGVELHCVARRLQARPWAHVPFDAVEAPDRGGAG